MTNFILSNRLCNTKYVHRGGLSNFTSRPSFVNIELDGFAVPVA
jgi:hypothetical protein